MYIKTTSSIVNGNTFSTLKLVSNKQLGFKPILTIVAKLASINTITKAIIAHPLKNKPSTSNTDTLKSTDTNLINEYNYIITNRKL